MIQPASGVHIILPETFCKNNIGFLDPNTSDGRVIFILPWKGKTILGTTDEKCSVSFDPLPTKKEVDFLMKEVKHYLGED